MDKYRELQETANEIRKLTIKEIGELGVGHVGGAVDLAELMAVLYYDAMNVDPKNPKMEDRDRLVLSKGHAGPVLYATLASKGFFPTEQLSTLNRPKTHLPSHCDMRLTTGIDMTTGSLGQGFSAAMGMAMAAKMDKKDLTVFTVVGDGESQEGQIWEAAMFAGSKKLDNVIAFTDYNNMQIDGCLEEVNGLYPLDDKWKSFGWHVQEIDGHDCKAISLAIDIAKKTKGLPHMILLHTIKGKGISFAENKVGSHNMPVTEEMWKQAVAEIEGGQA
jgi:transketolase